MKEIIRYVPSGVCSRLMEIETEDDRIVSVKITGGCSGNSQGVAALLKGMEVTNAIERLEGICCGMRPTSCPDQIAEALKRDLAERCRKAEGSRSVSGRNEE